MRTCSTHNQSWCSARSTWLDLFKLDEDAVEVLGVAEDDGLPVGADLGLLVDGTDALGLEHLQRSVDVLHLMCAQHARTRPIVDATSAN